MIWIVLAFIFSNAFTGLYCYLKGLARGVLNQNKEEENGEEETTA